MLGWVFGHTRELSAVALLRIKGIFNPVVAYGRQLPLTVTAVQRSDYVLEWLTR